MTWPPACSWLRSRSSARPPTSTPRAATSAAPRRPRRPTPTRARSTARSEDPPRPARLLSQERRRLDHDPDPPVGRYPGSSGQPARPEQRAERDRQDADLLRQPVEPDLARPSRLTVRGLAAGDRRDRVGRDADQRPGQPADQEPLV